MIILTSSPLDNQGGDSRLNSRHSHWRNKPNTTHCAHGHSAQNSSWLPRSALQNHLQTQLRVSLLGCNINGQHKCSIIYIISTKAGAQMEFTCVSPCWPAAVASLGTAVMILPGVPVVITFVVRIVIGVFMPALLVTPVTTAQMP